MSRALHKKKFVSPDKKHNENSNNNLNMAVAMLRKVFPTMNEENREQAAALYGLTPEDVESFMDIERENKRKL